MFAFTLVAVFGVYVGVALGVGVGGYVTFGVGVGVDTCVGVRVVVDGVVGVDVVMYADAAVCAGICGVGGFIVYLYIDTGTGAGALVFVFMLGVWCFRLCSNVAVCVVVVG